MHNKNSIGKRICLFGSAFFLFWTSIWASAGLTLLVDYLQETKQVNDYQYLSVIPFFCFIITGVISFMFYNKFIESENAAEIIGKKGSEKKSYAVTNLRGNLKHAYNIAIILIFLPVLGIITLIFYSIIN